jgi:lipopolysaccharide transport system ATP-binding protein
MRATSSSHPAVRVTGVAKQYAIGASQSSGTLYDTLAASLRAPWRRWRGAASATAQPEQFWALRDVTFDVAAGEVVGIIGRNGAGKSTLLKVLSRITAPTKGRIEVRGRLASLLEVGTGFHPELSGRENIFLNGAILGMNRGEITRRFDEIVAFAEVDRFVDTPVKRYSSGMYVRLAFAVAAHLETDVLLVDEVLAVGDASFQRKSMGKMSDVAKGGRTVLFVSHNLGAVRNLCARSLLFDGGALRFDGSTGQALSIYESRFEETSGKLAREHFSGELKQRLVCREVRFQQDGVPVAMADPMREFCVEVHGEALADFATLDLNVALYRDGSHVTSWFDTNQAARMGTGPFTSRIKVPGGVLRAGRYTIGIGASTASEWMWGADVATLDFSENLGGRPAHRAAGAVETPFSAERIQ